MQSIQQLAPGTVFAKDFRIERVLGVGGMGAVYVATDAGDGRRVALKLMHPSQVGDAKSRQRFAQEARVGAWIGSPHVVEVIRAGVDESGVPWIAMELLEGATLASRIQRYLPGQGLPHDEAWLVLAQLLRGLAAAHEKGVVHRDLKPENVYLADVPRTDAPFTVKILDFGIAKRIDPHSPESNKTSAIGTPLWMAPEQNETTEITPAADVWATALVCFRMFTGRYYWLSANERELNLGWLYHELVSEPLSPARERAEMLGCELLLPAGMESWFARCLVRDPKQRFQSAREMAEALSPIAPPYFKPFEASTTLPPDAMRPSRPSAPSPAPASTPPTMVMAAPPPAPVVSPPSPPAPPSPAHPSPAPVSFGAAPVAVSSSPPSAAPPMRAALVAGLVVGALVLAAGVWVAIQAREGSSAPPSEAAPTEVREAPREVPAAVPSIVTPPMPQGPVPVEPPRQRTK